jgi:hypothetical protein
VGTACSDGHGSQPHVAHDVVDVVCSTYLLIDTRKPQSRLTLGVCPHRITRGLGLFVFEVRTLMNLTDPNNSVMGWPRVHVHLSSSSVFVLGSHLCVGERITAEWRGAEHTSGLGANLNLNLN